MPLAADATLLTIRDRLCLAYVIRVLEALWEIEKSCGDASVRIAVSDDSHCPAYEIAAVMDLATGETQSFACLHGTTHREMAPKTVQRKRWSTAALRTDDVRLLINEVRHPEAPSANGLKLPK